MLSSLLVLAACTSDAPGPRSVSAADAYVAAIEWYVAQSPIATVSTDTSDGADADPFVLFIAPADGNPIDAQAQVDVVAELADISDLVTVVFTDVRDDAIDIGIEGQPVKDRGALILVGKVREGVPPVDVSIEVYHNVDDDTSYAMRIVSGGSDSDDFGVTAVTELEQN